MVPVRPRRSPTALGGPGRKPIIIDLPASGDAEAILRASGFTWRFPSAVKAVSLDRPKGAYLSP